MVRNAIGGMWCSLLVADVVNHPECLEQGQSDNAGQAAGDAFDEGCSQPLNGITAGFSLGFTGGQIPVDLAFGELQKFHFGGDNL